MNETTKKLPIGLKIFVILCVGTGIYYIISFMNFLSSNTIYTSKITYSYIVIKWILSILFCIFLAYGIGKIKPWGIILANLWLWLFALDLFGLVVRKINENGLVSVYDWIISGLLIFFSGLLIYRLHKYLTSELIWNDLFKVKAYIENIRRKHN